MGWWDRWVWSRIQNREALTLEQLLAQEATPTHAGVPVGTDQALRLSAVWACGCWPTRCRRYRWTCTAAANAPRCPSCPHC